MTGQSLKNPNFFFKKLEKLDKPLFLTENEGKFKSYSRTCPSNMNLQPVILTEDEKAKIDKEHPGSYSEAVKYGSDPKKPYWYICPRYWSLKDGVSLTEADVKSGKYGTIIPPKAKTVPPGGNIFEFTSELYHKDENGKYVQHYPGFKATDKHPTGKCIPCCFSNWNSNQQTERRDICRQDGDIAPADETPDVEPGLAEPEPALVEPGLAEPEPALAEPALDPEVDLEKKDKPPTPLKKNETRKIVIKTKKKHDEVDEYIKGIDKFPLEPARYGFLPISIQKFIHTDNKKCQISISNTNIKTHHVCMLRRGVEVSRNQSFIGCIADFYAVDPRKPILSIKQMKEQLIEAMDLDIFLKLQNGNLVAIFGSDKINNLDLTEFANTRIFANTDKANNEQLALLNRIVNAYENFKKYLRDETIEINYTYLWDLICQPNPKLFIPGLNMAILELKNNDITDNVHLICPTNHYSYSFFDINKPTIMLLKIGDYYEVILSYEDKVKHIEILKFFSLRNKSLLPNIKKTLELIMKSAYEKCGPLTSMPKVYTFVQNIPLEQTVALLKSKDYEINGQIINYSGKIIGIWAEKSALSGFIPCQPSPPLLPSVAGEVLWMDDTRKPVRQPYEATVKFLNQVHRELKGKIPCKPAFKVIEDELIVGVLTTTNQFVALSEPAEDTFGEDLPVLPGNDYIAADKKIANEDPDNIDHERINYIQKIKLENKFFNVFRNMLRNIFGQFRYREVRAEIEQIIASPTLLYLAKIKQVDTLLRKLTQNLISFIEYDEKVLQQLGAITNCNLQTNKTMCAAKPFCMASDTTDTCAILVPRINLINGKQNEAVYFGRLADELVRYDRVKAFMFNPKSLLSLSFADIKYNLKDDELILLHSLLLEGYFDDLVPLKKNHYIKNNTFETAQPLKTQIYANAVASNLDRKDGNICEVMEKKKVAGIWQALFPPSSSEYTFPSSPASCSFNIFLQLIKEADQTSSISRNGLKELLLAEYEKYTAEYLDKIIQILSSQGKNTVARQVLIGQTTLHNLIMSEDYYATNIDLWLLATRFKLPIVFFSVGSLLENNGPFLITYKDDSNSYFFIRAQSVVANVAPVYKLVVDSKTARARIPVASLAKSLQEDILESLRTMSENPLQVYIENFRQKRQLIKRKINVRPPAPASASASAPARKKLGKITLI